MRVIGKRVLVVGINYPPEITGIAPYTGGLASGLAGNNLDVAVITAQPHYPEWLIPNDFKIWRSRENRDSVSVSRYLHYVPKSPRGVRRLVSELSFGFRTWTDSWGSVSCLVLVTPALFSSVMALIRNKVSRSQAPSVVWVQDLYALGISETGQANRLVQKLIGFCESWLFRNATKVVVIHDRFSRVLQQEYGLDAAKIEVVRNWTHVEGAEQSADLSIRQSFGWGADEIIVLHSGNMGVKQGLENVIEAARLSQIQNSNVRFVLMGQGSERKRLEDLSLGLTKLEIRDSVAEEMYMSVLASADLLLVNELNGVAEMAVPSKLTSYMQSGTAIIAATSEEGITAEELSRSNAGVVVRSADPQALLDASIQFGSNTVLKEKYARAGKIYVREVLSKEIAIMKFKRLIDSLIATN